MLTLAPSLQSVEVARAQSRLVCDQNGVDPQRCGDVTLIVSELVGNAVRHARPPLHFDLLVEDGELVVVVEDGDEHAPGDGAACCSPDQEGGRGMFLVSALSRSWGWQPLPAGKRVWARL